MESGLWLARPIAICDDRGTRFGSAQEEIGKAKRRFGLPEGVGVLSCYEAGRDGFWLHRYLGSCGVENLVVDSSSIEVSRRKRRAKTDRLDARKLLRMLVRHAGGERGLRSVVRVPGEEEEGGRHLHRELKVLRKERTMHRNRIQSLLILQGVVVKNPSGRKFLVESESVRAWDGRELSGEDGAPFKSVHKSASEAHTV